MVTDERPAVADALRQLENRRCPIDGGPVAHDAEYAEDEHRFDQCARGHTWPYGREAGEWWPDEDAIDERLFEYGERARAINDASAELLGACELALAFHAADTRTFVDRYGTGFTTRMLCDQLRAAIAKAKGRFS